MNVQGPVTNPTPAALAALLGARPQAPARTPAPAEAARTASPAEAASLWDLLTPDERTFFTQLSNLGQLGYAPGPPRSDERNAAAPTGQRIDVRG